ncbi:HNH endonuclease [Roseomonas sp. NAR14]|uniref:HNH endonuclease n=1 Tax=Roseomonas acroporae TaxID=2937791 RepID=A0A9X1Y890_9PROT|nr:HNH endonuclease [Roseomonas acroporae]MCK8783917.1 HNH endonuclease [Roseomonas acroporae]
MCDEAFPNKSNTPADMMAKRIFPAVFKCIYCGSKSAKLSAEHILPESLGGKWELPKSSCDKCSKITSKFEMDCARALFGPTRVKLKIPRKNGKKLPKTLSVSFSKLEFNQGRKIAQENLVFEEMDVDPAPAFFVLPLFWRPGIFTPIGLSGRLEEFGMRVFNIHLGDLPEGKSNIYSEVAINIISFARLIAKIAHGFAIAVLGLDGLVPFLSKAIIVSDTAVLNFFVGADQRMIMPINSRHEISFEAVKAFVGELLVVRVRLFSAFGTPVYQVVVGSLTEQGAIRLQLPSPPAPPASAAPSGAPCRR